MKLRVVIADDEALGRERLRHLLQAQAETEIVAECATGEEALKAIKQTHPDLLFLDVKMPHLNGLEVIEHLNGTRVPVVIFVTAHDQFAARAFDAHAADYLLKPFDRQRFQTALNRAYERLQCEVVLRHHRATPDAEPIAEKVLQKVAIKSHGRISFVNTVDIDWIRASDNYVELHVGKSSHFLRMTLTTIAAQLPAQQFLRVSRSHLVNLERIKEIRPRSHGDALIVLTDGTRLPASRKYRANLASLLANAR